MAPQDSSQTLWWVVHILLTYTSASTPSEEWVEFHRLVQDSKTLKPLFALEEQQDTKQSTKQDIRHSLENLSTKSSKYIMLPRD